MVKIGTRGAFGVVVDGVEKIGYCQYDTYPEGHGVENLQWIRSIIERGFENDARQLALDAKLVDDTVVAEKEDIEKLSAFTNLSVSKQSTDDWYCLTRDTHGQIRLMLDCGYILDSSNFPYDSLFCEWAYIIDFDKRQFEVYKGFQKDASKIVGRFSHGSISDEDGYAPVTLIAVYSFDDLPSDDDFLLDTAGPECSDCTYRRTADESTLNEDGTYTCQYCIDDWYC